MSVKVSYAAGSRHWRGGRQPWRGGHAFRYAAYSTRPAAMDAAHEEGRVMLRKHWKKMLIAGAVLVPGLAWAGLEVAEQWCGWCPFC